MASIETGQTSGKRAISFDLNLVPFIDLLSVCICFLLVSAAWLQLEALSINQGRSLSPIDIKKWNASIVVKLNHDQDLTIELKKDSNLLQKGVIRGMSKEDFLSSLETWFSKSLSQANTSNITLQDVDVTIYTNKDSSYGFMITVIDFMKKNGLKNFAITGEK